MFLLQEAQVQIPAATTRAAAEPHSMLVEMPADFDVTGDAGGVGRIAKQIPKSGTAIMVDIKGMVQHAKRSLTH